MAHEIAHCLPIPEEAPVTITVFPDKENGDRIFMVERLFNIIQYQIPDIGCSTFE
jgi:hypothetical protein